MEVMHQVESRRDSTTHQGEGSPMLTMRRLSKLYRTRTVETAALDGIDLQIDRGEYVAITGPSGCGKSTLLALLGMLDVPTSGDYEFEGIAVAGYSESKLARTRRGKIGFVFQSFNLLDDLTVEQNVALALEYANVPVGEHRSRIAEVLNQLGVGHRAGHRPSLLSGGQQQRVAIARAVVSHPSLLLADEPTGNLDSAHGAEVMRILRAINEQGTTVVMVTHSPVHALQASRTVEMLDGKVVKNSA